MSTKKKILNAALSLFNESNTQAATTNHIAQALGISPGNLHYHYKNREAIVFALYEQMQSKSVLSVSDLPATIRLVHEHQQHLVKVYYEYRFFHRELLFLLSRDEKLRDRYIADNRAHRERIFIGLKQLVSNGYLELPVENVLEHLADAILMNSQFWQSHLETLGLPIDEVHIERGFIHVEGLMRPYLTQKALKELAQIGA
jgi:AcrR family transcriptional regulator